MELVLSVEGRFSVPVPPSIPLSFSIPLSMPLPLPVPVPFSPFSFSFRLLGRPILVPWPLNLGWGGHASSSTGGRSDVVGS